MAKYPQHWQQQTIGDQAVHFSAGHSAARANQIILHVLAPNSLTSRQRLSKALQLCLPSSHWWHRLFHFAIFAFLLLSTVKEVAAGFHENIFPCNIRLCEVDISLSQVQVARDRRGFWILEDTHMANAPDRYVSL